MFGIGFPELILILALALIVVGPDKLPEIARSMAKFLVDLKKTAEGLKESFNEEDNPIKDIKPQLEDAAKNFKETILDEQTNTWKPTSELDDLQSVIDSTMVDSGENPAEPKDIYATDEEQGGEVQKKESKEQDSSPHPPQEPTNSASNTQDKP